MALTKTKAKITGKRSKESSRTHKSATHEFLLDCMYDKSYDEQDGIDEDLGIMPVNDFTFSKRCPEAIPIYRCPDINLTTGGGLVHAGKITCAWGAEFSGKTLLGQMVLETFARLKIESLFRDHESKFSLSNIDWEAIGIPYEVMFGVDKEGNRIPSKRRLVNVSQPRTGPQTFKSIRRRLRGLPDKLFFKGKWYLGFNKDINSQMVKLKAIQGYEDKNNVDLLKPTKKVKFAGYLWHEILPTKRGMVDYRPQLLVLIDSIAQMLPQAFNEDSDAEEKKLKEEGGATAEEARMFAGSYGWKYVKSMISSKHVGIFTTNQLRSKVRGMGDPDYQPGGNATKHNQSIRAKVTGVSLNTVGLGSLIKGMTKIDYKTIEEPSVEEPGKTDKYVFSNFKLEKHDSFNPPDDKTDFRIWKKDAFNKGRGIDPVWQYWKAGKKIGVLSGKGAITFKKDCIWSKQKWTWLEFKALIVLEGDTIVSAKRFLKNAGFFDKKDRTKYNHIINLKNFIDSLIENGEAFDMWNST